MDEGTDDIRPRRRKDGLAGRKRKRSIMKEEVKEEF